MANRKAWNHLGMFSREEAVELIGSKMVSQKRRVKMKEGIRIVYYCNVQRSSGCRYEMSVIVPAEPTAQVSVDDINTHSCDPNPQKRRRGRPCGVTDLDKPLVKRKNEGEMSMIPTTAELSLAFLNNSLVTTSVSDVSSSLSPLGVPSSLSPPTDGLALFMNHINEQSKMLHNPSSLYDAWNTVECEIGDFSKMPDGKYTHVFHAKCTNTYFSYASAMVDASKESILAAVKKMCYLYGPPHTLKFDGAYREMMLEGDMIDLFPNTMVDYHPVRRSTNGQLISRREPATVKERIFAWMMERGMREWEEHLAEIKYAHNTEFVEDIESTPLERFLSRDIPGKGRMSKDEESEITNESHEAYSECGTEEATDEQTQLHSPRTNKSSDAIKIQ